MRKSVIIYSTPNCGACLATKAKFRNKSIPFVELPLTKELIEEFKSKGLLAAPIVVTETRTWAGFKIELIQSEINRWIVKEGKDEKTHQQIQTN